MLHRRSSALGHGLVLMVAAGLFGEAAHAQSSRTFLAAYGTKLLRVGPTGAVETFTGQPGEIWGMTVVPPGVPTTLYQAGDTLAVEKGGQARVWIVRNAVAGVPQLQQIGTIPAGVGHTDLTFAHGRLYVIHDAILTELNVSTFAVVPTSQNPLNPLNLNPGGSPNCGGIAFDGVSKWYLPNTNGNVLIGLNDAPPMASGWTNLSPGGVGVTFGNSDLEWAGGRLWGALQQGNGSGDWNLLLGSFDTTPGAATFSTVWTIFAGTNDHPVGLAVYESVCAANCDLSTSPPVLNVADFICFQNKFAAGDPYANCDGSTAPPTLNVADFICFLNKFAAGCP